MKLFSTFCLIAMIAVTFCMVNNSAAEEAFQSCTTAPENMLEFMHIRSSRGTTGFQLPSVTTFPTLREEVPANGMP